MTTDNLPPGTRVIRIADGMRGVVEWVHEGLVGSGALRVVFVDRGERMTSPRTQGVWVAEPLPDGRLRQAEMIQVAIAADRELKAIMLHEPLKPWEPHGPEYFDSGLAGVILNYLDRSRG